jgi:hypothetical protein
MEAELRAEDAGVREDEARVRGLEQNTAQTTRAAEATTQAVHELYGRRNELQERRKDVWRRQEALAEELAEATAEMDKGRQALGASIPKHISQGLAFVERLAAERGIQGYLGTATTATTRR